MRPSALPAAVRRHLGCQLQAAYRELVDAEPPKPLRDLIGRLGGLGPTGGDARAAFRDGLVATVPALRGYAESLCGNPVRADDLVQETLLKAWANQENFIAGTNLKAWLFTILRNHFYSECRKNRREVEDGDGAHAARLTAAAAQEHGSDLRKVLSHMARLPAVQREALLLVGTQGLTYEAAAAVMGCQIGTAKSRVSRARACLVEMLEMSSRAVSA